jgi:hypothetical protein
MILILEEVKLSLYICKIILKKNAQGKVYFVLVYDQLIKTLHAICGNRCPKFEALRYLKKKFTFVNFNLPNYTPFKINSKLIFY